LNRAKDFMARRPHLWLAVVTAVMLLVGIFSLPYGYFQVLRWIVCGISIYLMYLAVKYKESWIAAIFGVMSILFNPIFTIHFEKSVWQWIDAVCASVFIVSIFILHGATEGSKK
jgi:hypothetical protein